MKRLVITATVLLAFAAWGAGGKEESVKGDKSPSIGATPSADIPTTKDTSKEQTAVGVVKKKDETVEEKAWALSVGSEFHQMAITNPNGEGASVHLLYWFASFRWAFTKHDKVSVRFGMYERFLADEGETGVRTDDLGFSYSHEFGELVWGLNLAGSFSLNAPISFYSQKMGLITAPGVSLELSRKFGPISTSLRAFGGYFIQRYDSMQGGAPNPRGRLGFAADVSLDVPKVEGLSIGVDAYTSYVWFYTPQLTSNVTANAGMYEGGYPGISGDPTYAVQPMLQSYGGEAYIRYSLPEFYKIHADVSLAVADGDPTVGSNSVLKDGVGYFYLFNPHTFGFYGTLSARY
jgi:hypothetical protein